MDAEVDGMDIGSPQIERRTAAGWTAFHWMHVLLAVAAIALYVLGGIAQSRIGALPDDFPIEDLAYPVWLENHEVSSESELRARAAGQGVGRRVDVRWTDPETGAVLAQSLDTVRANAYFHDLVTRLNGFFFLAVTLLVFAPRADMVPARDLYWACLLYGLAVMIGGVYAPAGPAWPGALLPLTRIVSLVVLPTLMLHVGLTFPRRWAILDRWRWLMPAVAMVGLVIASWYFWTWLMWLEQAGSWSAIDLPRRLSSLFLALVFGSGCLGIILGQRSTQEERKREAVKWVLFGIAMGGTPYVFLHALPLAVTGAPLVSLSVARIFSIVIPLTFSLAVVRYKFLDVDIIIRRSLIYVALTSILVGFYVLVGIFLGRRVEEAWPATGPFVPIVATLGSALLFAPTRRGISLVIDRVFFKIRYTHGQALNAFQARLRGTTDQQQAADSLARFLKRTLYPRGIAVALRHDDKVFVSGDWPDDQSPELKLHGDERVVALPATTARPEIEAEDFPRRLRDAGFVLAHELRAEGHRIGAVALGEKRTGRSYVGEDLDLLAAVTRETALRVQRMNLEQDFVDEVVARHHMEEMSRFRTQFFAQFAHDLRSPLTSINWGARNLLDGVVGPVTPQQTSYLEGIETSARQLVRLVNNLLEVTRLESGMPEVEFETVDLTRVVDESMSKLRATAATNEIDVLATSPDSALVDGNAEKMLEIVDNLIENAIRYSPPGSTVNITLETRGNRIALTVEDEGPGLAPEDIDSIFEPYRQGKPSPHSSQHGFGLGLFVVKSWTERMDGQVSAGNHPDGGAVFTLDFPAAGTTEIRETKE
jgi:signal transduction histidine kinase